LQREAQITQQGKREIEEVDLIEVEDTEIDLTSSSSSSSSSSSTRHPYHYPASSVPLVLEENTLSDGTSFVPARFSLRLPTDPADYHLFNLDRLFERILDETQSITTQRVPLYISSVLLDYFDYEELHYLFDLDWGTENLYYLDEVFTLGNTEIHLTVDINRWTLHLNTRGLEPLTTRGIHY
jgi:hypothetical protein